MTLLFGVAALTLMAGAGLAHHNNPTCQAGSYTQTWNTTTVFTAGIWLLTNECVLVQADIILEDGAEVRMRDSRLSFDNDLGNFTVHLNATSVFEMRDQDGLPTTTADRSVINETNVSNVTTSFFFNVTPLATVYFNDTDIVGGGLTGLDFSYLGGFVFRDMQDFAWNRVNHTTAAHGMILINWTRPLIIPNYNLSGKPGYQFGFGIVLVGCSNMLVLDYFVSTAPGTVGAMVNDSTNITFRRSTIETTESGFVAHRATTLVLDTFTSVAHRSSGIHLDGVTNANLSVIRLKPNSVAATYGLRLTASANVSVRNAEIWSDRAADVFLEGDTRDFLLEGASLRLEPAGFGVDALSSGTGLINNNLVFRNVLITAKGSAALGAVRLRQQGSVLFDNVSINQSQGFGLILEQSADVRFFGGYIALNQAGAISTSAANLSLMRTNITNNDGGGILVQGGSLVIERSSVRANGLASWSVRSAGLVLMAGPTAILNSTLEGNLADAVNLTLSDASSGATFRAFNTTFVRPGTTAAAVFAVYVGGFDRVEIENCTLSSHLIAVYRSTSTLIRNVTGPLTYVPAFAVSVLVEVVSSVTVENVRLAPAPLGGLVAQSFRVISVSATAELLNLSFVRASYGVFATGAGGSARAVLRNITGNADSDLVSLLSMQGADASLISGVAGRNGFTFTAGGFLTNLSLRDAVLQAAQTGVMVVSDNLGTVSLDNVSFGTSGVRPLLGVSIASAASASIARVDTDGLRNGTLINDVARTFVSRMNFRDNAFGLRMLAPQGNATLLNWTISEDTEISNTTLLVNGEITVDGATLTLRRSANLTFFATVRAPNPSRVYFLGASGLHVSEGSRIVGAAEDENTPSSLDARFTLQFGPLTTLQLRDATLIALGSLTSAVQEERGIFVRSQSIVVTNVTVLDAIRPFQSLGVDITVQEGRFQVLGGGGGRVAVTVTNGTAILRGPGTSVRGMDGIDVRGGDALIENVSFDGAGAALVAYASQATIRDTTMEASSSVVFADQGSDVLLLRVFASFLGLAVNSSGGSHVNVTDSGFSFLPTDVDSTNGAIVEYHDTMIERYDPVSGDHQYGADTSPSGTFRVFWHVSFGVCRVSGGFVSGAQVRVRDLHGTVIFSGLTDASGNTGPVTVMQYQSQNGAEAYFTPVSIDATFGTLTNSSTARLLDGSTVALCLDDVPPTFLILAPPNPNPAPTSEPSIFFEGRAWDNESGLARGYPCYSIDNDTCVPVPATFEFQVPLHEGVNHVRLVARDNFGNELRKDYYITQDNTDPAILGCDPPPRTKVASARLSISCLFSPDTVFAQVGGIATEGQPIFDSNKTLHVVLSLKEGPNDVQFSYRDGAGHIVLTILSWTLDTTPPTVTFTSRHNTTINVSALYLSGQVSSDTVEIEFNGAPVNFSAVSFSVLWKLGEGHNEGTVVITDDVGNAATFVVYIDSDTQTHCQLFSPQDGERVLSDAVTFGGACDGDVTIVVEGAGFSETTTPREDGKWSVNVPLRRGENEITVRGTDPIGATWQETIRVVSSPSNSTNDPALFIALVAVAAGIFVAAFVIMRQPRRRPPEEAPRPSTGAQKAPPRPKPAAERLPEVPSDQVYRPKPPTGPPGGR